MVNTTAWKKVKTYKKKLVGMLTDELAMNIFNFGDRLKGNNGRGSTIEPTRISHGKVPKRMPSKFK